MICIISKNGEDISINKDACIKTNSGKEFRGMGEHEYCGYNAKCNYNFDLSTYDSTDLMELIIPLDNGNDIILKLEKLIHNK